MKCLLVVALVACGGAQAQRIPADPPAPLASQPPPVQPIADPPAAPKQGPTLDEATAIAQSRGWWEAYDQRDVTAVTEAMSTSFVMFEDGRLYDRTTVASVLENSKAKNLPVRTRTWTQTRVFNAPGSAIFIGLVKLELADKPVMESWTTLAWAHDGTRWSLAYVDLDRAGLPAEKERWNEYFAQGRGFNKEPNKTLVEAVKGRKAGTALDLQMGQGRNAVFLATQGWKTTGIDISDEGIRQAKAAAAEKKVKLEALLVDSDNYDLGKNKWDLITLIYSGTDATLIERSKPALKKGGLFVVEYFHAESDIAKSGAGGFKTGELAAAFKDGFDIVRDEVVDDNADWASQRKTKLVRFVAKKK
jgi:hypothetical protein